MKKIDPIGLFVWLVFMGINIVLCQYDTVWSYRATLLINVGAIILCLWSKTQS